MLKEKFRNKGMLSSRHKPGSDKGLMLSSAFVIHSHASFVFDIALHKLILQLIVECGPPFID